MSSFFMHTLLCVIMNNPQFFARNFFVNYFSQNFYTRYFRSTDHSLLSIYHKQSTSFEL